MRLGNALSARRLAAVAGAAVVFAAVPPVQAQGRPLSVRGNQGLSFGMVIAGVPTAVSRTDPLNSGQLEIRGQRDTPVRVTLTLPSAMNGPLGATLPMAFAAGDGGYAQTANIAAALAFDPRSSLIATLSGNGRLYLYLGGQVIPAVQQRPGAYTATITATVQYL